MNTQISIALLVLGLVACCNAQGDFNDYNNAKYFGEGAPRMPPMPQMPSIPQMPPMPPMPGQQLYPGEVPRLDPSVDPRMYAEVPMKQGAMMQAVNQNEYLNRPHPSLRKHLANLAHKGVDSTKKAFNDVKPALKDVGDDVDIYLDRIKKNPRVASAIQATKPALKKTQTLGKETGKKLGEVSKKFRERWNTNGGRKGAHSEYAGEPEGAYPAPPQYPGEPNGQYHYRPQ